VPATPRPRAAGGGCLRPPAMLSDGNSLDVDGSVLLCSDIQGMLPG
jgi:hypothetical protein